MAEFRSSSLEGRTILKLRISGSLSDSTHRAAKRIVSFRFTVSAFRVPCLPLTPRSIISLRVSPLTAVILKLNTHIILIPNPESQPNLSLRASLPSHLSHKTHAFCSIQPRSRAIVPLLEPPNTGGVTDLSCTVPSHLIKSAINCEEMGEAIIHSFRLRRQDMRRFYLTVGHNQIER